MDYYGEYSDVSSELYHHGILGMKWGVRRYQNEDGSLTDAGRKRYGVGLKERIKSFRQKRKRARALKKRQQTIAKKKAYEKDRKEAIDSSDPTRILKYQKDLSNEELRAITERIRLADTLKSQSDARIKTGMDKVETVMNKISRAKEIAEKGIAAYNTAAKIHNSFVEDDKKWTVIDGSGKKDDRKAIKEVIKTGDPEAILRLRGKLTVDEITQAYKSINNWDLISDKAGKQAVQRANDKLAELEALAAKEKERNQKLERYYQQSYKERVRSDAGQSYWKKPKREERR